MALGEIEVVYRVVYSHEKTKMRKREYTDLKELWDDVLTFLAFGPGASVKIKAVDIRRVSASASASASASDSVPELGPGISPEQEKQG